MADYLSRFPESLIHHILSFLPFNEIGRTCVLSKYFNSIWCNYPNLDFSFENPYQSVEKTEEDFMDCMENSLGQCLVWKPFIQQLSLEIRSRTVLNNLTPKLDRWLCLSVNKNVSRLVLRHNVSDSSWSTICYSVPHQVLVAKRLKVLDLSWCVFNEDSFVRIELPRLENLSLFECQFVGDNLLQKILCGSPKMKHVSLSHCKGLVGNSLSVSCTPLLKHFLLRCENTFERINIDVPSLKRLILNGSSRLNDIEIYAPNLHSFAISFDQYIWGSKFKFSSWNIPKGDDIHMKFSAKGFQGACRKGLQDFLMKLPNYEDLKLLIFNNPYDCKLIMIMELHVVSFYSLEEFASNSSNIEIIISSRDETNLVHNLLSQSGFRYGYTISIMCNSWHGAEFYCKKLGNWSIVKDKYVNIELVSPAKVQMPLKWKSFVKSNSRGINQSGAIILHASKRSIK